MNSFLAAAQFLTIVPVKAKPEFSGKILGKSLAWFPFVGMLIGLALSLCAALIGFLPQAVVSILTIIASIIITGGMHLDGFADTCDGLSGSHDAKRSLEIMRDPHIGTMASCGVALLLLFKFVALCYIPRADIWRYLIAMCAFARWSQVLAASVSGYARSEGKAKHFIEHATLRELVVSGVFTLALFTLLFRLNGFILFYLLLLAAMAVIVYIKSRIGGMTGDTIGAVNEISEAAALLAGIIMSRI